MRIRLALLSCVVGLFGYAQSPGTFTATGSMTTPRSGHTATLLADGRVLLAGGDTTGFNTQSSAELYDPRIGTFTATGNMTTPRSRHTATLLPDGRVLIAGGVITKNSGAFFSPLASAELYDPRTGAFSGTGQMSAPQFGHTATLLNSGKVLIAGVFYPSQDGAGCCSAELYDPDTGTFAPTGKMTVAGIASEANLLPDGKILVTKSDLQLGPPPYLVLSHAELYDPLRGTFAFAGYTETNHDFPTTNLMMNGKVLIAGGDVGAGDGGSFVAEHYNPATQAFSRTGNMTVAREGHTATLLPDGSVLFAGGDLAGSAEIYDSLKGVFIRIANMSTVRAVHTATLLGDGTVLVAGGLATDNLDLPVTSNAEIFHPALLGTA
ncbi:MAG TPA: kelch repeat-containing protein [Terriglobales bacterium]|nr:kelch repeat-containing protein [Terriglobales bacterium]